MSLEEFEHLFKNTFSKFCLKAYRMVGDKEIAKDLVQEVFIKFWNKKEDYKEIQSLEAYIYRSVVNHTLNYLNTNKRTNASKEKFKLTVSSSTNELEEQISLNETRKKIQDGIDQLSPMCKKVFLLSRHEEMTYKEIASFLKISENTVDNHIKKALKILREIVKNE